jgi:hypothetical protein
VRFAAFWPIVREALKPDGHAWAAEIHPAGDWLLIGTAVPR